MFSMSLSNNFHISDSFSPFGYFYSPMEVDPAESLKEAGEEQIPEALPLMASSQVQVV